VVHLQIDNCSLRIGPGTPLQTDPVYAIWPHRLRVCHIVVVVVIIHMCMRYMHYMIITIAYLHNQGNMTNSCCVCRPSQAPHKDFVNDHNRLPFARWLVVIYRLEKDTDLIVED
jgi:hypothetical protein